MHFWLLLVACALPLKLATSENNKNNLSAFTPFLRKVRDPSSPSPLSLTNYRYSKPPKDKQSDPKELKLMLGTGFNSRFMSVEPPSQAEDKLSVRTDTWRFEEILGELRASNLSHQLQRLVDFQLQPEHLEVVEKWMVEKASCPVRYTWNDLGAMFWPRYVRQGDCSTGQRSCSWPSGMHCVPSGTRTLEILRWQCRIPRGKARRRHLLKEHRAEGKALPFRCQWVKVPYPVTDECACMC